MSLANALMTWWNSFSLSAHHRLSHFKLVSDIFTKNNCAVDEAIVSELVDKLCHFNPLSAAFDPDSLLFSKYKRGKIF